jgi:4-diphosphocytidyl-2-C-methyl-D-erythritol kinase
MGGGLGGGSSDAATTLLALNHLWDIHWPRERLATLGLALGADVPVFVHGQNAFAEGVGDVLSAINLPPRWYLVVVPQVSVPTREIFADPALTRDSERTTMATFFAGHKVGSAVVGADADLSNKSGGILLFGRNDLEPVAVRRYAQVGQALAWLNRHAPARMTGSGACVFAEFGSERAALAVAAMLPTEMQGFTARGLAAHPLAEVE